MVCARHIEESARRDLDFGDSMGQRVRVPMHQLLVGAVASIHMGDAREPGRADRRHTLDVRKRSKAYFQLVVPSAGQPIEQPRERSLADQPNVGGHRPAVATVVAFEAP